MGSGAITFRGGVVVAVVGLALLGCVPAQTPESPVPSSVSRAAEVVGKFTFAWQPTPALDLMSREGTFVRAVVESDVRGGRAESDEVLFPGFKQVPTGQWLGYLSDNTGRRDVDFYGKDPKPRQGYGSMDLWVHSFIPIRRNSFVVVVCRSMRRMAFRDPYTGRWETGRDINLGDRIVVEKVGDLPPRPQMKGRKNIPAVDVFGSWRVPRVATVFNQCQGDSGDDPLPLPGPLPKDPPYPGWPSSAL